MKILYFKASWRKYKLKENSYSYRNFKLENNGSWKMLIFLILEAPSLTHLSPVAWNRFLAPRNRQNPELGCRESPLGGDLRYIHCHCVPSVPHRICIFKHLIWVSYYVHLHLFISWFSIPISPAFRYSSFFLPLLTLQTSDSDSDNWQSVLPGVSHGFSKPLDCLTYYSYVDIYTYPNRLWIPNSLTEGSTIARRLVNLF